MNWKQFVSGYLTFSRKDRAGVISLVVLIVFIYALPYLVPSRTEPPLVLDDSMMAAIDSQQANRVAGYHATRKSEPDFHYGPAPTLPESNFTRGALFAFDPNTLDAAGWSRLGLRDKNIRTILNYRSKGGKFYKPEDLQKIWGLPSGFYDHVKDYIQIAPKENVFASRPVFADQKGNEPRKSLAIDINTADTSAWIALPGIGSKLAGRIVNFRNKLGGFTSVEQVGETYGLPDSTFQRIRGRLMLGEVGLQQININTATKEELSAHPYINWKLANAIVAYREQHGPFATIGDLQKIMIMDDERFAKLKPYLAVK